MNLQVEVKLKLPGGAIITPSPAQQKQINEAVLKIVANEKAKIVRKDWTDEEDKELLHQVAMTDNNKITSKLAATLAVQFNRTDKAIISRVWHLQHSK